MTDTAERDPRRYFIVVRFGGETPIIERLRNSLENMKEVLSRISGGEFELAFRSHDAGCIGFLLKTKLEPQQIMRRLHNGSLANTGDSIVSHDEVLIVEAGEGFGGQNFGRSLAWLQHH